MGTVLGGRVSRQAAAFFFRGAKHAPAEASPFTDSRERAIASSITRELAPYESKCADHKSRQISQRRCRRTQGAPCCCCMRSSAPRPSQDTHSTNLNQTGPSASPFTEICGLPRPSLLSEKAMLQSCRSPSRKSCKVTSRSNKTRGCARMRGSWGSILDGRVPSPRRTCNSQHPFLAHLFSAVSSTSHIGSSTVGEDGQRKGKEMETVPLARRAVVSVLSCPFESLGFLLTCFWDLSGRL